MVPRNHASKEIARWHHPQSSLFTTFTELVTTTYRNHKKEVADNVSNHNALFRRLTQKGKIRREDGGLSIVEGLEYAENSTLALAA